MSFDFFSMFHPILDYAGVGYDAYIYIIYFLLFLEDRPVDLRPALLQEQELSTFGENRG